MGTGYHGGFGNTRGAAAGDAVFQSPELQFFRNIARRSDIDRSGVYDVVAHGAQTVVQISHNGQPITVNSRVMAKMLKSRDDYRDGQPIRLLSCNTGSSTRGFAQNLANKLNVVVEAPTKLVWAYPDGHYIVAARRKDNPRMPNLNDLGTFERFYPGGKKK